MKSANDGFFTLPYTDHDYIILFMTISGVIFQIYLLYRSSELKTPKFREAIGIILIAMIMSVGIYELAIGMKMKMQYVYLPFAFIIILSKDVVYWMLEDKDGKRFVIATFKTILNGILKRFGYEKVEQSDQGK